MNQQWKDLEARLAALTLRERFMVGGGATAAIIFLVYTMMIEPAQQREKALNAVILQQRTQMSQIDVELAQRQAVALIDPDQGSRDRLAKLKAENAAMRTALRTMQKGLVAPEHIAQMLEQMLKGNKLKLVALKTLPPRGMSDGRFTEPAGAEETQNEGQRLAASIVPVPPAGAAPAAPRPPVKQEELLYRHGVQLVLQGSYLDMVAYMEQLERMPSQLFWGKAKLEAEDYPKTRLTLTLYTLSLDTKWITL